MYFYGRIALFILLYSYSSCLHAQTIQDTLFVRASQLNLHNDYQWKKLLHIEGGAPKINDSSFLFSYPNFSSMNELNSSLNAFFKNPFLGDEHAICKFPARYHWIKNRLKIGDNVFPRPKCIQLDQYLQQVKLKDLKLVFAAGDPTSPSGMMGHIFFKIIGQKSQGLNREYAVSFFTTINSINIPSLLFKGLVTGMKGFFVLRPYAEQEGIYLKEENRNMWEYDLNIPYAVKHLIYLHFWELKNIKIKYLYTQFNCSTIVQDMLSLASKNLSTENVLWLTPQKVIRNAKKAKLLGNVYFKASDKQSIKILIDKLKQVKKTNFLDSSKYFRKNDVKALKFSHDKSIKTLESDLLKVYSQYSYINDDISAESFFESNKKIVRDSADRSRKNNTKNTFGTLGDIQLSVSYIKEEIGNGLELDFLPYSSTLYEDNRGYFGESDIRLMELGLLVKKNNFKVNTFNLYSTKSLLPWNSFTRNISSSLEINYKTHYDKNLNGHKAYNISIGKGYTKELSKDFYIYSMLNIGLAYSNNNWYSYLAPEAGAIFYESSYAKTILEYKCIYNQSSSHEYYHDIKAIQSFFINKNLNLSLEADYRESLTKEKTSSKISLHYYF